MAKQDLAVIADRIKRLESLSIEPRCIPEPVQWAENVSGTTLDDWQKIFLLSDDSDVLFNCSRQVGKSQIVSLKAAYRVKFLGRNVAVLAPTLRQSSIIYRRAKLWLQRDETEFARQTINEFEVVDGGNFAALPGDRPDISIRGDVVDDLIVDEASRIKDALIVAATPATATRTDATITYLTTPAGKQGAFWRAWSSEDWWHKISVKAQECARISPAFLAREKRRLGPLYYQEYECEFLDMLGGMFSSDDLDALFSRTHDYGMEDGLEIPVRKPIWEAA